MTDEQKDLFSRYTDAVREYQTMAEYLLFQNSFKLGAKMMVEIRISFPLTAKNIESEINNIDIFADNVIYYTPD